VDLQSGSIFSEEKKVFRFRVRFRSAQVRGWVPWSDGK
jgi:hypothetical protein